MHDATYTNSFLVVHSTAWAQYSAPSPGFRDYLNLSSDALFKRWHMRNDTYQLTALLKARKGIKRSFKRCCREGCIPA